MSLIHQFISSFAKKPKTFEEESAEGVREKTKNYKSKEARFVSHTVYPVYKKGKRPETFTVYYGAHA